MRLWFLLVVAVLCLVTVNSGCGKKASEEPSNQPQGKPVEIKSKTKTRPGPEQPPPPPPPPPLGPKKVP
jgi:hypothetical protein